VECTDTTEVSHVGLYISQVLSDKTFALSDKLSLQQSLCTSPAVSLKAYTPTFVSVLQSSSTFPISFSWYLDALVMPRGLQPVGVHDQPLAFIDEGDEEGEEGIGDGVEVEALLSGDDTDEHHVPVALVLSAKVRRRAFLIRALALLCACSLSIGSH